MQGLSSKQQLEIKRQIKDGEQKILRLILKRFDIADYAKCYQLDLIGWHKVLLFRYTLSSQIGKGNRTAESSNSIDSMVTSILIDPLPRVEWDNSFMEKSPIVSVTDLQIVDFWFAKEYFLYMDDAVEACELLEQQMASSNSQENAPELVHRSMHSYCLEHEIYTGSNHEAKVSVDLYATDDQLRAEFNEWLSVKRTEMELAEAEPIRRKLFSNRDMRQWCEMQVLAYIDLKIIEKQYKLKIPNHVLGELLFLDTIDIDVTERVRKVVKPIASSLMKGDTQNSLQFAAYRVAQQRRRERNTETLSE